MGKTTQWSQLQVVETLYPVISTARVEEAVLLFKSSEIDLLLTDFDMPIINGFPLGHCIKNKHPKTKVIIMTGYCQAEIVGYFNHGIINAWLVKPFSFKTLRSTIEHNGVSQGSRPARSVQNNAIALTLI